MLQNNEISGYWEFWPRYGWFLVALALLCSLGYSSQIIENYKARCSWADPFTSWLNMYQINQNKETLLLVPFSEVNFSLWNISPGNLDGSKSRFEKVVWTVHLAALTQTTYEDRLLKLDTKWIELVDFKIIFSFSIELRYLCILAYFSNWCGFIFTIIVNETGNENKP